MAEINRTPMGTLDTLDSLSEKTIKLDSLLAMTYGDAYQAFNGLNDEMKDAFLWAVADMAREIKDLVSTLTVATVQVQA